MSPAVAVLGSCTFDIVFSMARMPVPGETLFAQGVGLYPGGKGLNQAIAAARLGARAAILGRIAEDAFGAALQAALAADDIDVAHLAVAPGGGTGLAVPVVVPGGGNSILAAPGANLEVTTQQVEAARPALERADAFLVQFETPMEANLAAARIAARAGAQVILNAAPVLPAPPELFQLADVLVVNEVEAAMLAPEPARHEDRAAQLLAHGPRAVVVTLGAPGAVVATKAAVEHVPSFPVPVVDSVGAGDAFCGALAVALAEGQSLLDAVRFGCAAGALSVTRAGAAPSLPRRAEVELLLRS